METDNIISKASSGTTGPRGSELPIIASSMVIDIKTLVMPDGKTADYTPLATAMDEFKECGFNSFIARLDYDYMNTLLKGALSLAQAKNLFIIIVSDALDAPSAALLNLWDKNTPTINGADKAKAYKDNFDGRISGFLKICGSYNSFGGVSLTDEPTLSQLKQRYNPEPNKLYFGDFATTEGSYYCLSNRYQIVRTAINKNSSISGNVVIMVNLVGIHETPTHIEGAAYEDYLSAYSNLPGISGQQPYLWSYDIYPIRERSYLLENNYRMAMGQQSNVGVVKLDKNGEVTVKYNDFYEDLRLFNEKTTGKDSVYWTYIQSMSYMAGLEFHPLAQEQYLRFAIFSSLAMGCQGIMYWTYHQRANQRNELYLSAPIDRQDGKTPVWYYAKKVNAEIREYNSVFRGCKLEEYGHVGQIYAGCKELSLPIGRLAVIFADGEGVLVTRISNEKTNYEYIIIVSHSVRDYQKVTVSFKAGNTITEMTALGGKSDGAAPADVNNQSVVRTLAPGGYMIFSYLK